MGHDDTTRTIKRITFRADDAVIDEARECARAANTTLNQLFRRGLVEYTQSAPSQSDEEGIAPVEHT